MTLVEMIIMMVQSVDMASDLDVIGDDSPRRDRAPVSVLVLAGGLVLALLMLFAALWLGGRPAPTPPTAPAGSMQPILVAFEPTAPAAAIAWFADGTHRDISVDALARAWQPDRPVRMVTVASSGACAIQVGDDLIQREAAPVGALAQCVWVAPGN